MQLLRTPPPLLNDFFRKPPPLWYVTNGDVTVGPVTTNLLMLGVLHDRIPDDCMVRERKWQGFRELDQIRELRPLRSALSKKEPVNVEPAKWIEPPTASSLHPDFADFLEGAEDRDDIFDRTLKEAMQLSGALVGAVHRRMPPYDGFVTTSVAGPGSIGRADRAFAADELTFAFAAEGRAVCEATGASEASERVCERLGYLPACAGVATVPLQVAGRLYAVLELGRPDHEFRTADFKKVATLTSLTVHRIETVRNPGRG